MQHLVVRITLYVNIYFFLLYTTYIGFVFPFVNNNQKYNNIFLYITFYSFFCVHRLYRLENFNHFTTCFM